MKKYKILENVAIADTAFVAYGKSLSELFENSAYALMGILLNLDSLVSKKTRKVELKCEKVDMLLFNFLDELLYIRDTEGLIFSVFNLEVKKEQGNYVLIGVMKGEKLDYHKHELFTDIKAITMHMFYVKRLKSGWEARVVVDV